MLEIEAITSTVTEKPIDINFYYYTKTLMHGY